MRSLLRLLILCSGLCLLSACGGGSTSGVSTSGGGGTGNSTLDPTGVWSGSFSVGGGTGSTAIIAVIEKGGAAFFYDQTGAIYVLPQFSGSANLSGTLSVFAPSGVLLNNGQSTETFMVAATITATSITGTFTGNNETATFTLAPLDAFGGNPSVVAGDWQGFYLGPDSTALALTVQSGGVFVGTDTDGCNLTGNIMPNQGTDVFDVTVDSTGGSSCAGNLSGLAFETNQDLDDLFGGTTGTYYYVVVSNATGAFVAELKVQ